MEYQMDKSVITNRLYALSLNLSVDPPTGRWNLLPPEHGRLTVDNLPIGKAFMRYQMFNIAHPFITLHDNFLSISSVISAPWRVAKTFQWNPAKRQKERSSEGISGVLVFNQDQQREKEGILGVLVFHRLLESSCVSGLRRLMKKTDGKSDSLAVLYLPPLISPIDSKTINSLPIGGVTNVIWFQSKFSH